MIDNEWYEPRIPDDDDYDWYDPDIPDDYIEPVSYHSERVFLDGYFYNIRVNVYEDGRTEIYVSYVFYSCNERFIPW